MFEKTKSMSEAVARSLKEAKQTGYLGNRGTVAGILRNYAFRILTGKFQDADELATATENGAKLLVPVFLGQDKRYPGPAWFGVGQVDVHVAKWSGTQSDDPTERVAGALVSMISKLLELSERIHKEKLIEEQWQGAVNDILDQYTDMFLGLAEGSGLDSSTSQPRGPINRLPGGKS